MRSNKNTNLEGHLQPSVYAVSTVWAKMQSSWDAHNTSGPHHRHHGFRRTPAYSDVLKHYWMHLWWSNMQITLEVFSAQTWFSAVLLKTYTVCSVIHLHTQNSFFHIQISWYMFGFSCRPHQQFERFNIVWVRVIYYIYLLVLSGHTSAGQRRVCWGMTGTNTCLLWDCWNQVSPLGLEDT